MSLDTIIRTKPVNVTLSKELTYKQPTDDLTEALESKCKTRNAKHQLNWEMECPKKVELEICVVADPGNSAIEYTSLFYI